MTPSNHDRTLLARLALATGGPVVLVAVAALCQLAAGLIGGARGMLAGILVAGAVFAGCGLAHSLRSRRPPGPTRPGPVRPPERTAGDLEPVA